VNNNLINSRCNYIRSAYLTINIHLLATYGPHGLYNITAVETAIKTVYILQN